MGNRYYSINAISKLFIIVKNTHLTNDEEFKWLVFSQKSELNIRSSNQCNSDIIEHRVKVIWPKLDAWKQQQHIIKLILLMHWSIRVKSRMPINVKIDILRHRLKNIPLPVKLTFNLKKIKIILILISLNGIN